MQIIFQDPYSSLNPRMNVEQLVIAPLQVFRIGTAKNNGKGWLPFWMRWGWALHILKRYRMSFPGGSGSGL